MESSPSHGLRASFLGRSDLVVIVRAATSPLGDAKIDTLPRKDHQQLFIFEGFSPNGLQIRIQRKELHILTPVKIDVDDFGDFSYFMQLLSK